MLKLSVQLLVVISVMLMLFIKSPLDDGDLFKVIMLKPLTQKIYVDDIVKRWIKLGLEIDISFLFELNLDKQLGLYAVFPSPEECGATLFPSSSGWRVLVREYSILSEKKFKLPDKKYTKEISFGKKTFEFNQASRIRKRPHRDFPSDIFSFDQLKIESVPKGEKEIVYVFKHSETTYTVKGGHKSIIDPVKLDIGDVRFSEKIVLPHLLYSSFFTTRNELEKYEQKTGIFDHGLPIDIKPKKKNRSNIEVYNEKRSKNIIKAPVNEVKKQLKHLKSKHPNLGPTRLEELLAKHFKVSSGTIRNRLKN